jgi:uncharacterized protein YjiS (DUF1127 family)
VLHTIVDRVIALVSAWLERRRQRRLLASMNRSMRNDIGITADEARSEIDRPY